jgi:hypothetical protein
MTQDECLHGMAREGCASCGGRVAVASPSTPSGAPNNRSKQRLLDDLCDLLGVARFAAVPGRSPSRVFDSAAVRAKVKPGSMPTVGAAIAAKAGLAWGPECDNRRRKHEATMVTREGVAVLTQALVILDKR